jgi:hypothetical protein
MPFAAGVGSADAVLPSMFVAFQIVGDPFTLRTSAKNQLIRWVLHAKVFHGSSSDVSSQHHLFTINAPYRSETLATPHSKQRAFSRDVINPQNGHIRCDRSPAIRVLLRIQWSSRIVVTIKRPTAILVAFNKNDPSWLFRVHH